MDRIHKPQKQVISSVFVAFLNFLNFFHQKCTISLFRVGLLYERGWMPMKPSTFKKGIEKEFDYISKQTIRDERKDYMKHLSRLSKRETSFSMIDDRVPNQFSTIDKKPSDYHTFSLNDFSIHIENDLLAEALKQLSNQKREILLLHYFMNLSTQEIAEMLDLDRSTIYRNRKSALETIKKFMEGKINEEPP